MLKKYFCVLGVMMFMVTKMQAHQDQIQDSFQKVYIPVENIEISSKGIRVYSSLYGVEIELSNLNKDEKGFYFMIDEDYITWQCPESTCRAMNVGNPLVGCTYCGWRLGK